MSGSSASGSTTSESSGVATSKMSLESAVEHYVESVGANLGLTERQLLVQCPYCGVGNPVGVGQCSACGAGLADVQPIYCTQCGKLAQPDAKFCSRCGAALEDTRPQAE